MGIYDKVKTTLANLNTKTAPKSKPHSSYWLRERDWDFDLASRGDSMEEAVRLASIKRAISNFVQIITGKKIPVIFSSGKQSYTTGEEIVVSADTRAKRFDAVVGLALHEASHVLLTDFEFVKLFKSSGWSMVPEALKTKVEARPALLPSKAVQIIDDLMNIIEDRRIDYFLYRSAPGYRPYYEALYNAYFKSREVDIALAAGTWTIPTIDNYLNQIINSINEYFQPDALPKLSEMIKKLDWENINRLDTDADGLQYVKTQVEQQKYYGNQRFDFRKMPQIFQLAVEIFEMMFDNSDPAQQPQQSGKPQVGQQGQPEQGEGDPNKEDNYDTATMSEQPDTKQKSDKGEKGKAKPTSGDGDEDEDSENDSDSDSDEEDYTDANGESDDEDSDSEKESDAPEKKKQRQPDMEKLKKALKKQKDFLRGKVKKKRVKKNVNSMVNTMEQSGAELVDVGEHYFGAGAKTKVLVLKKLTREILESGHYPFTHNSPYSQKQLSENYLSKNAIKEGIRMGTVLAQRIAVRNQERETKYVRQQRGKIEKRLIAGLGYDAENVFYHTRVDQYGSVHMHLTIDASGSMNNVKWSRALSVGVAVAFAAEKIKNIDITMSIRAGIGEQAVIAIIYDSRTDKFTKVKNLFPYLVATGGTPEGLTFEAIMGLLTAKTTYREKYFVNLSDGEPAWQVGGVGYGGDPAAKHTRQQVQMLRDNGIKILSYFIEEGRYKNESLFRTMYGQDAAFIDVNSIPSLVNTINKLFMKKGKND